MAIRRNASRLWLIRGNGWNEMERKLISGQVRSAAGIHDWGSAVGFDFVPPKMFDD
jgi:hypothetical protein